MTTKTNKPDRRQPASAPAPRGQSKGGKKGRRPAPVRVGKERNWGPILMFVAVGVIAAGIIGYAFVAQRGSEQLTWEEQASEIDGIVNYRETNPESMTRELQQHQSGVLQYDTSPPAYGVHNGTWQNCQGTVYDAPIASEHAVHSLEHGAIWVTYNPDLLPADQVDQLADLVRGNDKIFMSPYPELDRAISVQAWGYQLKVDGAGDPRINDFIRALRTNASIEGTGARCDGGITTTGTTPTG